VIRFTHEFIDGYTAVRSFKNDMFASLISPSGFHYGQGEESRLRREFS
jgi:hypothetical protein